MVYEIATMRPKYKVFLEALLWTFLILLAGFLLGFYIESYRGGKLADQYRQDEVKSLNIKLQNYYYQIMNKASCKIAIKENIRFADENYEQGLILERYENLGELTGGVLLEKKKYVLLKEELWLNSIILKEKCNNPFHTVVYFYSQNPDLIKDPLQSAISNTLRLIKEEQNDKMMLIPVAGDLGLSSIELQMRIYNVTELPSILIDEETVLTGFNSQKEIEKYLS